ncbi:hypothetical protein BDF20DRAFT_902387 [Mycotypha africana]|uniref:uncharacterized protein n=1 Tax=Mycotypha africana TaxID=64632 RepID=UPI0022FFE2BB|nr:uncharacterized protein BDF20DRAFT_902387 [Mycotypha africana]KAI8967063.1 hypothetical protein BDF20DRAFT_902387 [Mycotypha africana]
MQIPEDLLLFKIPSEYRPGDDKLSKIILSNSTIVDQILKFLLDVAPGTYTTDNTEWSNALRSDILYVPRIGISNSLPPILIEVQKRVDKTFMARLITYFINVFMRYKCYPIVLIFCVDTVSQAVMQTFEQSNTKENMFETTCYYWAKNCYLTSNRIIEPALSNESSANKDPIVAIQYFFGSQQRNIMTLDLYDDVTIVELYTIAKNETEKYVDASESQLNALATICSASEDQFKKIKNILKDELAANSKALKYVNQGIDYHSKLKRKYEEIIFEDKGETTTPMAEPAEVTVIESVVQSSLTDEEITFIENFISKKNGRMSWKTCWETGSRVGYFTRFGNEQSLRVVYSRLRKN